ncbi:LLM class flavin-dependent oxidoreductase [Mycobacterium tuberculosis]
MSGRSRLPGSSSRRDAARIVAERVVATVAGVAVAVDEVDAAEARLRDGPRAAALPASGTSEGRFRFGVGVGWLREEVANHGVDPAVRGRVIDERLRAIIEIWTQEQAEFHGTYVDFDPIYCWPKPVTKPYPPLYVGGGPANFPRIARLNAGWIAISPSPQRLSGPLQRLRAMAGGDVPVTVCQWGEAAAKDLEGYRHLGVERVLLELPTEPRDPTLRYLDKLQAELARLA